MTETFKLNEKLSGGGRSRQTVTVTAHRSVDAGGVESWSGTFKTRACSPAAASARRLRAQARHLEGDADV